MVTEMWLVESLASTFSRHFCHYPWIIIGKLYPCGCVAVISAVCNAFHFSYVVSNTYVMNYTGRIDATIVVPIHQKISNYEKIQRHHSIQRTKWVMLTCFGFISYYILHILWAMKIVMLCTISYGCFVSSRDGGGMCVRVLPVVARAFCCRVPTLSQLHEEFHLGVFPSTKRSRYGTTHVLKSRTLTIIVGWASNNAMQLYSIILE